MLWSILNIINEIHLIYICCCLVNKSCLTLLLSNVAHEVPLSMGFSKQKHWSELPFPSPKELPDPGIQSASPTSPALQADLRWTTQEAQKTQNQGILLLTVVSRRNSVTYLFFLKAHHFRGNWKCPPRPLLCLNCFLNLIKFNVSISKVFTNVKRFFWPLILSPLFDQEFCIFCKKETICPSVFCQVHAETWGFD